MRLTVDRLTIPLWSPEVKPIDPSRVQALAAEAAADGDFRDPLHVLADGDRYIVLDGQHRLEAARINGWADLEVVIHAGGGDADALSLAATLRGGELEPDSARVMMNRLRDALLDVPDEGVPKVPELNGPDRRLLHDLLSFLHDEKRIHDARLAQLFDLGDAATAAAIRMDTRGLPDVEPKHLHEMPAAVQFAVRELMSEHLLARTEVEHLFPLNQRERIHLEAERALEILAGISDKRVTLKGSRWGPDYEAHAPEAVTLTARWPDGRTAELSLDELPGLDRHTRGIIRKVFAGLDEKPSPPARDATEA